MTTTTLNAEVVADKHDFAIKPIQDLEAIVENPALSPDDKWTKVIEWGVEVDKDDTSAHVKFEMTKGDKKWEFKGGYGEDSGLKVSVGFRSSF